jgi:hypothetical protein
MESVREKAMAAAKKHKSGWIELGKALISIEEQTSWREWGFVEFKQYCTQELGITPTVAKQMMEAYKYVKEKTPSLLNTLDSKDPAFIPDYYSVNVLSKAAGKYGEDAQKEIDQFHEQIFSEGGDTKENVSKLRDFMKSQRGGGGEVMDEVRGEAKKVKNLAKKLVDKLNNTSAFSPEIIQAAEELQKKIDAVEV